MTKDQETYMVYGAMFVGAVLALLAALPAVLALVFVVDWRNENTQRMTEIERVNLCAEADDITGCLEALAAIE